MVRAAGLAPAITRSQAGHVAATPRANRRRWIRKSETGETRSRNPGHRPRGKNEIGAPGGTCAHSLPADNGLLFCSATRAKWWEVLVTLQSSLPTFVCDTGFTDR